MKNKKLLKAIAVLAIGAAAMGSVVFGACDKDEESKKPSDGTQTENPGGTTNPGGTENPDDKPGTNPGDQDPPAHTHTYNWTYDVNTHHGVCVDSDDTIDGAHTLGSDGVCSVCGAKIADMVYEFKPSTLAATKYESDTKSGLFTVIGGTTIRTRERIDKPVLAQDSDDVKVEKFTASKSVQYNGSNVGFSVNAVAPGTLTFYAENGSSDVKEGQYQKIILTRPDGTTEELSYLGTGIRMITVDCDTEGEYKITRGSNGTTDVYYASFTTKVVVTEAEKIEIIDGGKTDYLLGEDLDTSGLQVQVVRKVTGMIEPVTDITIDDSAYNGSVAGAYKIGVTYTENGKDLKAEYTVNVYAVRELELGFNAIIQGSNTSAGNGTYINHTVKQLYFKGDSFDEDGLTVKAVYGNDNNVIVTSGYTITGFDSSVAGKQTVRVQWGDDESVSATFDVYVLDKAAADIQISDEVNIVVDGATADADVGTANNGGAYRFKTIQQSLDFLEAVNLDDNVKKVITLAEGTYKEKLEINIPNLTVKGADSDATKTVIEWDSLYGIADEGGFIHTTDSTATLNVRESAVGFVIENVTISNWYNSTEHFDEVFGPKYGEHRALAVLIQADKVVFENCRLLGYQDTLELFTGRQVFNNCYINGRTDFIFGTNNTTYFYRCEIESIVSGGYVTAFKGCNKGAGDAVTYGAIFDECRFTAPEAVTTAADTAIGRPWGAYAAVAVINSEIGGHISTDGYAGGSSGTRYVNMSGTAPNLATVKFVEYNNTGAGAISEAVAGMKMLSATEAANYSDKSVIFGTTNGGVTYASAWDGGKGVEITEKTYLFDAENFADGDVSAADGAITDIFGGDITVEGSINTEISKTQAKFTAGSVIKFNIAGQVTVTTYGSNYGLPENVNISYKDGKAMLTIVKTANSPIDGGCYITKLVLDKSQIPEDSEVVYSFVNTDDNINGTESQPVDIFGGDITVIGSLRNNNNSYQVTSGAVLKFNKQGTVKINWYQTYGSDENAQIIYTDGKATVTITGDSIYIESITLDTCVIPADTVLDVVFEEDKTIDLTAITVAYEGNTGKYEGIEIDATTGKFAVNGGGDWVQINTGTVLKVHVGEDIEVSCVEYNNAGSITISERDSDGWVTLTAIGNTYIKSISFTIVKEYTAAETINMVPMTGTYQGNNGTGSYKGILIDATTGKFGNSNGSWVQFNQGATLKIHVAEGLNVSVTEYEAKGNITVGERDADGWVTITATGNTYLSTIVLS